MKVDRGMFLLIKAEQNKTILQLSRQWELGVNTIYKIKRCANFEEYKQTCKKVKTSLPVYKKIPVIRIWVKWLNL